MMMVYFEERALRWVCFAVLVGVGGKNKTVERKNKGTFYRILEQRKPSPKSERENTGPGHKIAGNIAFEPILYTDFISIFKPKDYFLDSRLVK
jgi:hypothetical protein